MIININTFNIENYRFALSYLQKYKNQRWSNDYNNFQFELFQKKYDNMDFDINLDIFKWPHLMVAERYVEKYKTDYPNKVDRDSIMKTFYGELGHNTPFNRRSGGKTKRRVRRRTHRTPRLKKGTTESRRHKI